MSDGNLISFDDEGRVRVLDADKHAASVKLRDSCASFSTQVDQLKECSKTYVGKLEEVAGYIEAEKLRAVGLRNKVAALREGKLADDSGLARQIAAKQQELDNLVVEERSLQLMVEEQAAHIARLQGQTEG